MNDLNKACGVEIFDTKANPHIRWTCPRCGKRCSAKLVIPVDAVTAKHCQSCRFRVCFRLDRVTPEMTTDGKQLHDRLSGAAP